MSEEKVNDTVNEIASVEGNIEEIIAECITTGEVVDTDFLIYISNQLMTQAENLASINVNFAKNAGSRPGQARLSANLMAHEDYLRSKHSKMIMENAKNIQCGQDMPGRH